MCSTRSSAWGLGSSLALSLQAPPGFPDRHCDWQEAGVPQGNPSSRLGDPHCCLLLKSAGNQGWQPQWEEGASFHGNPQPPPPGWEEKA